MKIKEQDNRPKRFLKFGDLVTCVPTKAHPDLGTGIIIYCIFTNFITRLQKCRALFAPKEIDLFTTFRNVLIETMDNPSVIPWQGYEIYNNKLIFQGEAPADWFTTISLKELSNMRFVSMLNED